MVKEKKPEFDIFRPWLTLDDWQKEYIKTEGNCFLLCGRQSGKSAAASIKFGNRAARKPNQHILMIAYTEKQGYALFFKTLTYLREKYPNKVIEKGDQKPTKHTVNLTNGSQIQCYAAGISGDGLRGGTITSLVIDEAAPMSREVFQAVSPMISITQGTMDILSTPRGKEGFFYDCSLRDDFKKFYVSAEDCVRHTPEFLAREKAWMSDLMYAQEYLAQFMDDFKRVFSDEWIKQVCTLSVPETGGAAESPLLAGRDYFLGCDVGRVYDPSTFEILDGTDEKQITQKYHDEIRVIKIPETFREIRRLEQNWSLNRIGIDSGGMGAGVLDLLLEDNETKRKSEGLDNASKIVDDDDVKKPLLKIDMYVNLLTKGQKKEIQLYNCDEVVSSLKSAQWDISGEKTRIVSTNGHTVEGIMRALWLIKGKGLNLYCESY